MPGQVYSTLFMAAYVNSTASATAVNYTVPAGKVAVVRTISFVCENPGLVYVGRQSGGLTTYIESTLGLTAGGGRTWRGDHVFNAGQLIRAVWVAGSHSVNVSGFLLNVS